MHQPAFADRLLTWFDRHGRHDLPWQHNRSLYRVWLAEVMLQQTQVATVIPYYQRFLHTFPDLGSLALASLDDVLAQWAGLGYYTRARNLHRAAQIIQAQQAGHFPQHYEDVLALPGIGPSTAGAILAQALGQRHTILDGNVKRVLCRHRAIEGWPGQREVEKQLWELADVLTPHQRVDDYTQAIMDLGATLCTRTSPGCEQCPLKADCRAFAESRVSLLPTPRPKKPCRYKADACCCSPTGRVRYCWKNAPCRHLGWLVELARGGTGSVCRNPVSPALGLPGKWY